MCVCDGFLQASHWYPQGMNGGGRGGGRRGSGSVER